MNRRRRKIAATLVAGFGLGVTSVALYALRRELWVEWYRWRAAGECQHFDRELELPPTFDGSPTWRYLLGLGREGYPVLAAVLADRDPRIWRPARMAIEQTLVGRSPYGEALEGLPGYLGREAPQSYLRLFLSWGYTDCGDWQAVVECNRDYRSRWVSPDARLVATPAALAHVDAILDEAARQSDGPRYHFARVCEFRAVDCLALLRLPETDRIAPAALRRLEAIARKGPSAELRLHAINALACSRRPPAAGAPCDLPELWHWELFSRLGPKYSRVVERSTLCFEQPSALPALLSLDHPRALRVVARLENLPGLASRLEAARGAPGIGLSARKRWQTLPERAAAFLEGSPGERALAALALADLGDPAGVPLLRRALARESSAELGLLLRSALVALGDLTDLELVEAELESRAATRNRTGRAVFPPPDQWARLGTHGDEKAVLGFSDLVRHLLLSGSQKALDVVLDEFLAGGEFLLVALELTEIIDDFAVDWEKWNGRWTSRDEYLRVREWFRSRRDDFEWDAARRRYRLQRRT